MAVPSLVGDVKTVSSISSFVPVTLPFSLADLGEGPERGPGPPTLFLRQTEARMVKKYYFLGQAPSYHGVDEQLPPLA